MITVATNNSSLRHPRYEASAGVTHSSMPFTYEKLKVKHYNPRGHKYFSLRHPPYDPSTTLRHSFEQPFGFTMHDHRHRESAYVTVNVTYSSTPFIEYYLNPGKRIFQSKSGLCEAKTGAKSTCVETFWSHAESRNSDVL
jgi:hypothetical protein